MKRKISQSRTFSVKTVKDKQKDSLLSFHTIKFQNVKVIQNNLLSNEQSIKQNQNKNIFKRQVNNQKNNNYKSSANSKDFHIKKQSPRNITDQYLKVQYKKHLKEKSPTYMPKSPHKYQDKSQQLLINLNKINGNQEKLSLYGQSLSIQKKSRQQKHRPKSSRRSLINLGVQNFIIPHDQSNILEEKTKIKAFWKIQNKFVALIKSDNIIIKQFNHQNILQVFGSIKYNNNNYVVCDAVAMTPLSKLFQQFGPFQEVTIKKMISQIIQGLRQLEIRELNHNNISMENIYLNRNGKILIDSISINSEWQLPFVFSQNNQAQNQEIQLSQQQQKKLNILYRPPEMLLTFSYSHEKADVWAIGSLALQLLIGSLKKDENYHPYNVYFRRFESIKKSKNRILNESDKMIQRIYKKYRTQLMANQVTKSTQIIQSYDSLDEIPILSQKFYSFISTCLNTDQKKRPQLSQLKKHPFLAEMISK